MSALVAYITPHGFGHATRTIEALSAFGEAFSEVERVVVSDLPGWLTERLPGVKQRRLALDVGIVQADAVRMDLPATLLRLEALRQEWDQLVRAETEWLKDVGAQLVLSDIPAIPFEAAHAIGCPSVALTSFSWDWIYAGFCKSDPSWQPHVDRFAKAYQKCERLLSYPFSAPMENLPEPLEVPLVAERGVSRRQKLSEHTGADPNKTWLLFCLASMEFTPEGIEALRAFENYQFFTTGALNWSSPNCFQLSPTLVPFSDLVASVDAVVSKPGFGILSDCAANQKPIIYVEREGFREYPLLVEAIDRHLLGVHLPLADLCDGKLDRGLEWLQNLEAQPKEPLKVQGASDIASILGQYMNRLP